MVIEIREIHDCCHMNNCIHCNDEHPNNCKLCDHDFIVCIKNYYENYDPRNKKE